MLFQVAPPGRPKKSTAVPSCRFSISSVPSTPQIDVCGWWAGGGDVYLGKNRTVLAVFLIGL